MSKTGWCGGTCAPAPRGASLVALNLLVLRGERLLGLGERLGLALFLRRRRPLLHLLLQPLPLLRALQLTVRRARRRRGDPRLFGSILGVEPRLEGGHLAVVAHAVVGRLPLPPRPVRHLPPPLADHFGEGRSVCSADLLRDGVAVLAREAHVGGERLRRRARVSAAADTRGRTEPHTAFGFARASTSASPTSNSSAMVFALCLSASMPRMRCFSA